MAIYITEADRDKSIEIYRETFFEYEKENAYKLALELVVEQKVFGRTARYDKHEARYDVYLLEHLTCDENNAAGAKIVRDRYTMKFVVPDEYRTNNKFSTDTLTDRNLTATPGATITTYWGGSTNKTSAISITQEAGGIRTMPRLDGTFAFYSNVSGEENLLITNTLDLEFSFDYREDGIPFAQQTFNRSIQPAILDKSTKIITADNFADIENPTITYEIAKPLSANGAYTGISANNPYEGTVELQAAISLDGVTAHIPFRKIPLDATSYTFALTENEREILRKNIVNSAQSPIYFLTKSTIGVFQGSTYTEGTTAILAQAEVLNPTVVKRVLSIASCTPSLNPTVEDIKEETLALTGNKYKFIRYESMAEFSTGAVASKYATVVSQSVQCGNKTVYDLYNGVIDDVESATFLFNVTDSRGLSTQTVLSADLIEYIKPTCYQKLEINLAGETGAVIVLKVSGNYYNDSFGVVDNTLQLEVRYGENANNLGDWITLTGTPTFNGNTYELTATFSGFSYDKAYVFQCRAIDKLNVVQSAQYTTRLLPVFDWGENDFNFNVPILMNGETVLRHGADTNNTVLSASNGNIYIRPGGTDDTSGETIFYGNGNVKFNGTVTFADGSTGGGAADPTDSFADYVIETGETAMGSNGTWYWAKWASGKAECWGCRNFGNMAVTTAWGNLYRSAFLTQNLPDNVFVTTPDVININIVNSTFGGWICKHENAAPSAATTGSFIFVRPASATVTAPTYIGFHVIGLWKQ